MSEHNPRRDDAVAISIPARSRRMPRPIEQGVDMLMRLVAFARERGLLHRVGLLLSLTIISIAFYVLFHMLRETRLEDVLHAVGRIDHWRIALAASLVAAAYFSLTFYDWFALRTISKGRVPYRIAALASFTSYSIGHNIGATVFTGGAVRYRIYSLWGLNAIDVTKVCFIAGLTFWLGNAAALGLGITWVPEAASAIDQLPPTVNRLIALSALVALVAYVCWVWRQPRVLGRGNWEVTLPGGPSTLLQIGIGLLDLSFCALAMYTLLHQSVDVGFLTIAVIFVTATLLGFASHAPGGLGVFDAAMLVALWQYDRTELLASLFVFRLCYYVVPFVLALSVMASRELALALASKGHK